MKLKIAFLFMVLVAGCAARLPQPFVAVRDQAGSPMLYSCPPGWRYDQPQYVGYSTPRAPTGKCIPEKKIK